MDTPIATLAPHAATLDYASASTAAPPQWTWTQIVLFVLALPGLVAPFVTFTYGTSPLDVVSRMPDNLDLDDFFFLCLGASFFAAFPIVAWRFRRLAIPLPPGRWDTRVLIVVALASALPGLFVGGWMLRHSPELFRNGEFQNEEIVMCVLALASTGGGVWLSAWRWRRRGMRAGAETLLVTGYVTAAALCLFAFREASELGYWLTLPSVASAAVEMLLPPRSRA